MLLKELGTSNKGRIEKINRALKESYGFTLNSDVSPSNLRSLYAKVTDDLQKIKLNNGTARDAEYVEKLLVKEGLEILRESAMLAGPGGRALERVVGLLSEFVRHSCEVGDEYEEAIYDAMKQYRSSKYRFDDAHVEYEVRKLTADCAGIEEGCGAMMETADEVKIPKRMGYASKAGSYKRRMHKAQPPENHEKTRKRYKKSMEEENLGPAARGKTDVAKGVAKEMGLDVEDAGYSDEVCAECGNINDDNPGHAMCKTCDDWFVHGDGQGLDEANPDRYAEQDWVRGMKKDDDDELRLAEPDDDDGNDYFSYQAKRSKKTNEDEESNPANDKDTLKQALLNNGGKWHPGISRVYSQVSKDGNTRRIKLYAVGIGRRLKNNHEELKQEIRGAFGDRLKDIKFDMMDIYNQRLPSVTIWLKTEKSRSEQNVSEGNTKMKEGYVKNLRKLLEAEVEQAESLIAAKSFSQELQDMVEKLGRLVNEDLPAVVEQMRDAYGADVATGFEDTVGNTLSSAMDTLKGSKQELDNSVSSIADGGMPAVSTDMDDFGVDDDADLDVDADVELDLDDDDLELGDELGGMDAAAGPEDEPLGRAKKESVQRMQKRIVEMQERIARAKKRKK